MWYLLLIMVSQEGSVTSQQFPVGEKTQCEAKMRVFDNHTLVLDEPGRNARRGPTMRAICIEGK